MILQLDPPLPLFVIGKGKGLAHLVIDYGAEHSLLWTVALDKGGECWTGRNEQIRFQKNWTMGRTASRALANGTHEAADAVR